MSVFFKRRGQVPKFPKKASDYAIGSSVILPINGTLREFIIVNKGRPSSLYDSSCNGIWLLMKDIYETRVWNSPYNDYENSSIHAYLNNDFLNLFDSNVKSAIKQVKIPYNYGYGNSGVVKSGSNGLSTKVFLLSAIEVGWNASSFAYMSVDGSKLSYFGSSMTDAKRAASYNGTNTNWWTRSPYTYDTFYVYCVDPNGSHTQQMVSNSNGVRPALILDSTAEFDPDTNIIL